MKTNLLFKLSLIFLFGTYSVFAGNFKADPIHTWTGNVSSNWNDFKNWDPEVIPSSSDNVLIPTSTPHDPILESCNATICNSMILEFDGFKTTNSSRGGLTISGGEVVVDGSLTIKAGATMTIGDDGALTVNGNTKIISSGGLVIESGGSLITNGSITGSAIVRRIIANDGFWHFLSSPVGYQPICNGVFAPLEVNFGTTPITSWDFYKWLTNCPTPPEPAERWRNLRTESQGVNYTDFGAIPNFEVKKGYMVSYALGFLTTKVFSGNPNTGDETYSFLDVTSDCSWELAGNPYPSAFDWNQVSNKENLTNGYYYVWNDAKSGGAGYEAYLDVLNKTSGVNGNIPSMQGFFVKIDPAKSKQIVVPNSSRVHDLNLWLKNSESLSVNKLLIKLSNGSNWDESTIIFGSNGTVGKDWYDAEKILSLDKNIPQVYTIVDNDQKTLINSLPYTNDAITVPVGFVAPATGDYSLTISGIESFASLNLVLEDLKENTTQNLVQNSTYHFTAKGNEDAGRFLLHFAGSIGMSEKNNSTINIFSNEKTVYITCAAGSHNALLTVSNLLGQEILTQKLNDQTMNQVQVNALKGYYIVKVQNESSVKTAKVYIN